MPNRIFVFFTTIDNQEQADSLAQRLVAEKLVACATILPGVTSHYTWKEKQERSSELLLILKTTELLIPALEKRILEIHPYEVPEFVGWPLEAGAPAYLRWVRASTRDAE